MGNALSTTSTRRNAVDTHSNSTEIPAASTSRPQDADTPHAIQSPAKDEESSTPPRVVQRRRSLMQFPSLRRRPHSVIGPSGHYSESQAIEPVSPPSRRRWGAFSGIKSRPVSNVRASDSPATEMQPPRDTPADPSVQSTLNEKGKEREEDTSGLIQPDESGATLDLQDGASEPGPSATQAEEAGLSPNVMLQGLREFQDTLPTEDVQSIAAGSSQAEFSSSRTHAERPPTPIPTSGSVEGEVANGASRTTLSEALGSWMGGRPRAEGTDLPLNVTPVASSSNPYGPSSPHANASHRYSDSDLLNSFGRSSSQVANALGSPLPGVLPTLPASGDRPNLPQPQERRTLPPAGTGTLVVVQGVVHTTDVRHTFPRTPSTSQTTNSPSMRSPRPVSSTPTLRPPTPGPSSQFGSRASTPQPSSTRRSRFSSLTSSLRQRSRPQTPTSLRSRWMGGTDTNRSDSALDHSLAFVPAAARNASHPGAESNSPPAPSSSTATTSSTDEVSALDTSSTIQRVDQQRVDHTRQSDARSLNELNTTDTLVIDGNYATDRPAADDNERDGSSDEEESEAELSASSIEVLGTLLSVATAATAASLVTGTTDPLFSSGLAGPLAHGRNTTSGHDASPFSRSSHPTMPPSAAADHTNGEAAVNTRMRAAYETLRDRFFRARGRRDDAAGDSEEVRDDPREQMFREMARAFNMGLGLDAEDAGGPRVESGDNRTANEMPGDRSFPQETLPASPERGSSSQTASGQEGGSSTTSGPEGSFERFLHNLQVDLRTALTEDYAARRARAQARVARPSDAAAASSSDTVLAPDLLTDGDRFVSPDSNPSTVEEGNTQEVEDNSMLPDLIPTVPNTPRTANLDLPSLPGDVGHRQGDESGPPPQAQGITGQPGAGINWWRLYRFPPMQLAPHPSTTNTGASSSTSIPVPSVNLASSERSTEASASETRVPPTDGNLPGPSGSRTPSEATPTQNVVPVIVVGLQSVPVNRGGLHNDGQPNNGDLSQGMDAPTDVPGRDRAWPLRAASRAFGRMARRSDAEVPSEGGSAENTTGGSPRPGRSSGRTYLIFVIGGYYPPNHSIVTGADDMNSFEALWELAELLGQVKPPVASKEDIEKSGLEILKASKLTDYETSGKVASNTVERCLICLDDYESDDDLRLLSCRHIFHKTCVDKWLEQGKNNCPACRCKGVRTGDDDPPAPTTSPAEGTI